jgi:septum formation protein
MQIILASSSPRRQQLLKAAGFDLTIISPLIDEDVLEGEAPEAYVRRIAEAKVRAIAHDATLPVVAADTTVAIDHHILAKPADEAEARSMLTLLSGRTHTVFTAFAVQKGKHVNVQSVATKVSFRPLSEGEIDSYIRSGEPFDKAGGYGIQGAGMALVDRVEGSFTNVVGLPLKEVIEALRQ